MIIYQKDILKQELGKFCALVSLIVFLAFCLLSLKQIKIKHPKMLKNSVKSNNSATLNPTKIVKMQKIKPTKTQVNSVKLNNITVSARKTILFWNSFWHKKYFLMGEADEKFKSCPNFNNCYTTIRKSELSDPKFIVDAVVFHGVLSKNDIAAIERLKKNRQSLKNWNHGIEPLFVLYMRESPVMYPELTRNPVFNDFFNLTITYRLSADITTTYGALIHKTSQELVKPSEWLRPKSNFTKELSLYGHTDFKSRKKDIAWIVSNCKAPSHREDYVQLLKNIANSSLRIDIYGKCGNLKKHGFKGFKDRELIDSAYQEIAKDYKFYLSLENSICTDYVTEKFFNALQYGILPITNVKNIAKIAPPHSYLNTNDFNSTDDIMEELENISQSPELYNSYFWWNEFYTIVDTRKSKLLIETHCKFCDILNEKGFKSANNYSHFNNYWNQCDTKNHK